MRICTWAPPQTSSDSHALRDLQSFIAQAKPSRTASLVNVAFVDERLHARPSSVRNHDVPPLPSCGPDAPGWRDAARMSCPIPA